MPEPGDFLVTKTKNDEFWARLYAAGIRRVTSFEFNHAAIYLGDGKYLHSVHPSGVEITPYRKTWIGSFWSTGKLKLTAEQRDVIVSEGRRMVGIPYAPRRSILAYALSQGSMRNIINRQVSIDRQPGWVRMLIDPGRVVCSQLVALLYAKAGVSIPGVSALGLISPADLHQAIR